MGKTFKMLYVLLIFYLISSLLAVLLSSGGLSVGNKVQVIGIDGQIVMDKNAKSLISSSVSAKEIVNELDKSEKDDSIKAVILEINSPGGSVVGSKIIVDKIKKMDKPVIAVIEEAGVSGAYWVASACDKVYADQLSFVGSIGVLGSYLQFSDLLDEHNVAYQRLVAGKYKDIGSPLKNLTSEEKILLQSRIDEVYDYFVNDVAENRNMSVDDVKDLANGLFYLGKDAKVNGLVDNLGDMDAAFEYAKNVTNATDAVLVYKDNKGIFSDYLDKYSLKYSYAIGWGIGDSFKTFSPGSFKLE